MHWYDAIMRGRSDHVLSLRILCQHNFEHNQQLLNHGIMLA